MKTVLRNFASILRRYRLAAVLNVLGLSVAFAAFMMIMMQVDYDRRFDRCHPDADRIYRMEVNMQVQKTGWIPLAPRSMAEGLAAALPHVRAAALASFFMSDEMAFSLTDAGGWREICREPFLAVTPEFTDVFTAEIWPGIERKNKRYRSAGIGRL
jgi:putative ABC transport system permease protein